MAGATFTPGQVFLRAVRTGLREHVRNTGQVPSLICGVSDGGSPRTVHFSMRLDLLEDRLAVKALVQAQIREHASRYACIGGISTDRLSFVLAVVSEGRAELWTAPVDARRGLGGWERGGGQIPDGWAWIQQAIEDAGRG